MPEITLDVELPDVTETPSRIEVRCGETVVYVYEHGTTGNGAWAVWTSMGGSVVSGGTNGYPVEQARLDAREYVRDKELARLLYAQLRAILAEGSKPS